MLASVFVRLSLLTAEVCAFFTGSCASYPCQPGG